MSERDHCPDVQTSTEPGPQRDHLWAVVLAGGQGVRLGPLARRVCGDDRPKQYVPLLGSRTLLGQTLDRVSDLGTPRRVFELLSRVRIDPAWLVASDRPA